MLEKVWEAKGHAGAVYDIAYQHPFIYSASGDKYVTRWHVENGEQDQFAIKAEQAIYSLGVQSKSLDLWIGLSNGDIHVISTVEKSEKHFLQHHKSAVFSILHLSKMNQSIVADADGNLSVWNSSTVKLELNIPLNCGKIRHLHASSDEKLLYIHGQDGKIRILETTGYNEVSSYFLHKGGVCASIDLEKQGLISGGKDGHIRISNWAEEEETKAIPAHHYAVYDLLSLKGGAMILSASRDKTIKMWNSLGEFIYKCDVKTGGHTHSVNRLIQINETHFASCSDDKRIILWRIL